MTTDSTARQPAGAPAGGQFATTERPEATTALPANPFRVWIERDDGEIHAFGPYPDEAAAKLAMNDSLLIQGEVEDDCVECWIGDEAPDDDVVLTVIDPDDPDHVGDPASAEFWDQVTATPDDKQEQA